VADGLNWAERHMALAHRLSAIPSVAALKATSPDEPYVLAHALLDIQKLCTELSVNLLPRIMDSALSADELKDCLTDVGEMLRELLYHARDPQYYRYLPGCEEGNIDVE
jgi:hypothetical protein